MDSNNNNKDDNKNTYAESFCTMCFRPESACGKLINMGPNMRVCPDCIQRTIDKFNNSDSLKLGLFPGLDGMGFDDIFGLGKAPAKAENAGEKEAGIPYGVPLRPARSVPAWAAGENRDSAH